MFESLIKILNPKIQMFLSIYIVKTFLVTSVIFSKFVDFRGYNLFSVAKFFGYHKY